MRIGPTDKLAVALALLWLALLFFGYIVTTWPRHLRVVRPFFLVVSSWLRYGRAVITA